MGVKPKRNRIFAPKCHKVFLIANKGRLSGVTSGLFLLSAGFGGQKEDKNTK